MKPVVSFVAYISLASAMGAGVALRQVGSDRPTLDARPGGARVIMAEASPQRRAAASIENALLRITVDETGALAFLDKRNGVAWGSKHTGWVTLSDGTEEEQIALTESSASVDERSGGLDLVFRGIEGDRLSDEGFLMQVRITLNEASFDLEIRDVRSALRLQRIEYPAHVLTVESGLGSGYVVIPNMQGIIIPSRYDAGFMRFGQNIWDMIADIETVWSFGSGMLNMPWFGAHRGGSSVLVHVVTPDDCQLRVIGNSVVGARGLTVDARQGRHPGTRFSSLTPIWQASMQQFSYPRRLRLELVDGGYVGMAKRYRAVAVESGRHVTLKEKIARNPEMAKLIGAPDIKIYIYTNRLDNPYFKAWSEPVLTGYSRVHTTFDQVARMARELKEMGVDRALILLGGWNRTGYDREHVDMWPPAEQAGGIEGLRSAAETVTGLGYLFALHDNYHDFYTDAPSYEERHIVKNPDGSLLLGGVWDGGLARIMCSAEQRPFLDRNLGLIREHIPLNAYYFDVITAASLHECYDERHPTSRREDAEHRLRLFGSIPERGLVVGGERGADWAVPVAGFFEGMQGGGTGFHRGVAYRVGLTAPLFYLVYHDCVVGYWQHGTPFGREDHANHVLHDLLVAQPSSWSLVYDQWEDLKPLIKETYDLLGRLHQRTAHEPMTAHEYVTPDYMVQHSAYGDGTKVWVNYGITTYRGGTLTIPPKGFVVDIPGEPIRIGSVARNITYVAGE